jgi:amylosucrase
MRTHIQILETMLRHLAPDTDHAAWNQFSQRLEQYFPKLFTYLKELYGGDDDFLFFLEDLLAAMWESDQRRSVSLRSRDLKHDARSRWFMSNDLVGGICYVDLFAGDIAKLIDRLDYIEELGINYLHLMPMFAAPEDENDGGYAVSSYRALSDDLGSIDDLRALAEEMHRRGMVLVADFILNHTSDQHQWAKSALAGDPFYADFYFIFPDRFEPDQYQRHLRDIFPEVRKGSFTYHQQLDGWVWTTFNSFQWDLNYQNHDVFLAMAGEMLFLANTGIDVLRFDAVAFTWKEKGTRCESLPKAHTLVRAFRTLARIAAPSMVFKSEAIVHPEEVLSYIDPDECELSYNPLLMATSWEALAARDPKLLEKSVHDRYRLQHGCAWVNYVRCHDDIGWTFDDDDAWTLGIDPRGHRSFLNDFYTGRFPGSFARGLPFQENPETGDCRISGTCASLAGLEKGLLEHDRREIELALSKIELLYGIACTLGGIPLIYLGDELGRCNDYRYADDPARRGDSRWVHRIAFDWESAEDRHVPGTVAHALFTKMRRLITVRKQLKVLADGALHVHQGHTPHLFAFDRMNAVHRVTILANFSDRPVSLDDSRIVRSHTTYRDLLSQRPVQRGAVMDPWQFMIIEEYTDGN